MQNIKTQADYDKLTEEQKTKHHAEVRKELIEKGLIKPQEK